MSLKDRLETVLSRYPEVKSVTIKKDVSSHGRTGKDIEVRFEHQRLEMYYADDSKLNQDTVVELVKRAVESFINGTMEEK